MKNKEQVYHQASLFEEERIWSRLPPGVQEKTLVLCAQMVMELFRRAEKEVKTDEPQNHL